MTQQAMTLEGDERLTSTARHAADELGDMSAPGRAVGEMTRARAASNAPKVTGYLAGSVIVQSVNRLEVVIAATAEYSNIVESGRPSVGVPAKPFMANAMRDTQAAAEAAYAKQVSDTVDNVKGK